MKTKNKNKNVNSHNKGITLIALIVTIILLLILAGITINTISGNNGLFGRTQEAGFKHKISSMAETAKLHAAWQVTQTKNTNTSGINAGEMFRDMIMEQMIDLTEEQITFQIEDIIDGISSEEKQYVAVYKGELHYVSNPEIKNNEKQRKWAEEIGIPILYYESPTGIVVMNGNYELVKGIYLCTPKVDDGFVKEKTRYLNIDKNGNLLPGDWLTNRANEDWYDYKNKQWANVYIENNGIESYYTWIPRYAFKVDEENSVTGNERMDVKFIDIKDNSWIEVNEQGKETKHEWSELEDLGYQIPEAFSWINEKGQTVQIPGYWASKYTLGDFTTYTIDYNMVSNITSITVKDLSKNTTSTIAKYTYALNGEIVHESQIAENYEFIDLKAGDNIVNVTALDANGEIIGSMTKVYSPAIVNEPDLTGFDPNTTFYVTYDKNGIEYSHIPISQPKPEAWYEYGASIWANIVTRNNGVETYYTWIPRYEFILDQTSQRSTVKFISGTGNGTGGEYQVPEAFSWVDENGETKQLTGYWTSKYTLGDETSPRFDTEMVSTSSSIRTKEITGTAVKTGLKYMYYIDGIYKETKTQPTDIYEYTDLEAGKLYTVNIIVRNAQTEEYIGSITKQITTIEANEPSLKGFNQNVTYYVTYDENGNEQIGEKISSSKPTNWYDYSKGIWANIVVKTETATTYYT